MSSVARRLPIYLLVDCSESMAGDGIEAVNSGIDTLVADLRGNAQALETAWLSVITFSREAKQVVPLTEMLDFRIPKLSVRPGTALGAAIKLLVERTEQEIVKTTADVKGDYRALVLLLTDGQPTDEWEKAVALLRSEKVTKRIANFYAIGCGNDIDFDILRRVSDIVLWLPELTPESWRKFFVWLTASIQSASENVNSKKPLALPELPPFMRDANKRIEGMELPRGGPARQVFLHATCVKKKLPYLMRFSRIPDGDGYQAVSAHPIDIMEDGDAQLLPRINTSSLRGCPPCPYCGNPSAAMCPCGTLLCSPKDIQEIKEPITCPHCNASLQGFTKADGGLDVSQTQG